MTVAGADGCRRGWAVATRDGVGVIPSLTVLTSQYARIGVDMPVTLSGTWGRRCDDEARRLLAGRAATIFSAPPRALIGFTDYPSANAACRDLFGRGLTRQTFNLLPKIREVDAIAQRHPGLLVEVHPECSFRVMSGRDLAPKRTPHGFAQRRALVEAEFGPVVTALPGAARDDVLDAYAVLWSAERYERGEHLVLGGTHAGDTSMVVVV